MLADLGANLDQPNDNGATPAYIAAQEGHHAVLHVLGQKGADLEAPKDDGFTPAYVAAQEDHVRRRIFFALLYSLCTLWRVLTIQGIFVFDQSRIPFAFCMNLERI